MHPLAHMLTGALIGQMAGNPVVAVAGGLVSHVLLDAIPHTEGRTFNPEARQTPGLLTPDLLEAGLEFVAGAVIVGWLLGGCPAVHGGPVALGILGALLPDLVDQPLERLFQINLLHIRGLHWTVARRHALWGILTQLAVAGTAGLALWRAAGCG